jgi:hypothetical protein
MKERVMSVRSPRLVVAGVIAAAAIAIPTAALASGLGTASGKPTPPAAPSGSPAASKTPAPVNTTAAMASKAAAAQSQRGGSDSAMVAALASHLGVSDSMAQNALNQIEELGRGGIDSSSPAFAALAHRLGVSPAGLIAALTAAKQSLAG